MQIQKNCFTQYKAKKYKASLVLMLVSTVLFASCKQYRDPKNEEYTMEVPKVYSLDELKTKAISTGFDHRIELENLFIAKNKVKNAQGNLLPHIGISFALNFVGSTTFTPLMLLRSVGQLLPFLFPTNWLHKTSMKHQFFAEQYTAQIIDQNLLNSIDGLAFNYYRDKKLAALIAELVNESDATLDQVRVKEEMGLLPTGSTKQFLTTSLQNRQTLLQADKVLKEDLKAIALLTGFYNDAAIVDIIEDETLFENAMQEETLNLADYKAKAIEHSLEIKQINELIDSAIAQSKARRWNWFDPAGDGSGLVGFGLPSYVNIGVQTLEQIRIQKDKLHTAIGLQAELVWTDLQSIRETFRLVDAQKTALENRLYEAKVQVEMGTLLSPAEYFAILQSQMQTSLQYLNLKYSFLVGHSNYHRSLYVPDEAKMSKDLEQRKLDSK